MVVIQPTPRFVLAAWRRLPGGLALAGLLAGPPAFAQSGPAIAVPPAPAIVATPSVITAAPPLAPANPPPGLAPPQPPELRGSADLGGQPATPPANADSGDADAGAPAAPPPPAWLPGAAAVIGVLNVVEGSISQVTIPVGGQTTIGDLQVSVLACLRRPPDAIPDAAAFVTTAAPATGAAPDSSAQPGAAQPADTQQADAPQADAAPDGAASTYRGWMLRSAPGAAVVGDAAETFRVIDCQ